MIADPSGQTAYRLRITLQGLHPPIWRRIVVPGDITLDRLHDVIQIVFDWLDNHLHRFEIDGVEYTEGPEEDPDWKAEEEGEFLLCDLVAQPRQTFLYEYDFGDGWRLDILVEKIDTIPEDYELDLGCLAGERAAPPDDVGGLGGYEHFLAAVNDPGHPEHDRYLRWWGGSFDPEELDLDFVNSELTKWLRWSRPRPLA